MRAPCSGGMRRQRGWAGLVVLLLALVIVGFLMRTVTREMGLTGERPVTASSAAAAAAASATAAGVATPQNQVRAVEAEVLRQGARAAERLEAADK